MRIRCLMICMLTCGMLFAVVPAAISEKTAGVPQVTLETSMGIVVIVLNPTEAPLTTANFINYVENGYYDGTIFHRVIKGFMIQGGGFTTDMRQKTTLPPIVNEAQNGLKNRAGTIAMARTQEPHSATAQFFINTADNAFLDHREKTIAGWGYCVFGRVVEGMEVVRAIEAVSTTTRAGHRDVPAEPVVIQRAVMAQAMAPVRNAPEKTK